MQQLQQWDLPSYVLSGNKVAQSRATKGIPWFLAWVLLAPTVHILKTATERKGDHDKTRRSRTR